MANFHSLLILAILSVAGFCNSSRVPLWRKLSIKWGSFSGMPSMVKDAENDGWVKVSDCTASAHFRGNRYMLNSDPSLLLIFDSNGMIAGVQFAVPDGTRVPVNRYPPFVKENSLLHLTAYFIDPSTICSAPKRDASYIGDELLIQVGDTYQTTMAIPYNENGLAGSKWVAGKCFWSMGNHYWYDISKNMNCDDFFPVFLLYNGGVLNGFGWATGGDISSDRVEHPTPSKFGYFFDSATLPKCLSTIGPLTTQHVYLDRNPYFNFC